MERASDIAITVAQDTRYHYQNQSATLRCPRCDSSNTKFCYYNNYSLSQPRHFCRACKRYWTRGGTLRNVPVGGGSRKNKHTKKPSYAAVQTAQSCVAAEPPASSSVPNSDDSQLDASVLFPLPPSLSNIIQMPSCSSADSLKSQPGGIEIGYHRQLQPLPAVNDDYYSVFGSSVTAALLSSEQSKVIGDGRDLFSCALMDWNSARNKGVISEMKTYDVMNSKSSYTKLQFPSDNTSPSDFNAASAAPNGSRYHWRRQLA